MHIKAYGEAFREKFSELAGEMGAYGERLGWTRWRGVCKWD